MMTNNVAVRRAIRYALLANAAAGSAVLPLVATAQQAQPAAAETATPIQEVVVTGSRIVQPGLQAISPVTTVSNEEFKNQGVTRVEDLLNNLPQVVSDQAGNISNGSSGTAAVDLRGLGPNRTLVLINGRRLMPGAPSNVGTTNGVADLNQIPAALVERVDVLTGGASAVYGADAVAGVVNFVMNDHFQGFRIDANAVEYNHNQHNNVGFAAPSRGFGSAPSTVNDGKTKDITFILGGNFADGKGNVTAYLGYRRLDPLLQSQRDFSRCTLNQSNAGVVSCGGSSTSATGRFFASNGTFFPTQTIGPNTTFIPWAAGDAYNYGAVNYYQRPDERFTGGAFAHYNINENHSVYAEFMSMEDRTIAQIAQSGAFLGSGTGINPATGIPDGDWAITCDNNPLLSASQKARLCPGSVNGISQVLFGRRNVEGGFRQDDLSHLSFRGVLGFKGELSDAITYDAYFQEGRTTLSENYKNDVSKFRMTNALQVITDPATGQPICAANANGNNGAPGCVPWNIWTLGAVTPAQTNYISVPGFIEGVNEERIANANVTIDLTKWGVKLPSATTGLVTNVGVEYRAEYSELRPDIEFQTNDLAGQGNATPPLTAGLAVHEGFIEARLPLAQDQAFAKELSFETGYRYSTYSLGFNTNTYKFGLDWAPTSDVRFRASYNHAIRAPNLAELFAVNRVALDFNSDPCATTGSGSPPTATAAQCVNTGLSAAQYARPIPGNPASQYNGLIGGNPNLKPEISNTKAFGVVLTPSFLPTFNLTLDYFDIRITNVISSYTSQFIINTCVANATPLFCNLIHRDSTGSLWLSEQGHIDDPTLNLGALQTRGVDVGANYRMDLGKAGRLNFDLNGTYTTNFNTEPFPGSGEYNCAGYYGNTCLNPDPKWRHRVRATWATPVQGLDVSAQWRYFGPVTDDVLSPNPLLHGGAPKPLDAHLSSRSYLDLNVSYEVVKGVTARLGVNNALDKDPPIISSSTAGGFSNGNTYPNVYDALGRYVFVNITADF